MQRERRVISAQHRQLDDFYLRVAAAVDAGQPDAARALFARFADALEAHFALEDGLYFPALRGLSPALGPASRPSATSIRRCANASPTWRAGSTPACARLCAPPLEASPATSRSTNGARKSFLASIERGVL